MSAPPMSVRILLLARYAELLGHNELTLVLPGGSTVRDAVEQVRAFPGGSRLPARVLVARGVVQVGYETRLSSSDELAFLPPMAGG